MTQQCHGCPERYDRRCSCFCGRQGHAAELLVRVYNLHRSFGPRNAGNALDD